MTTVACDGKTIAADSLTISGNEKLLRPADKIKVVGRCIYATSGVSGIIDPAIKWWGNGCPADAMPALVDPARDTWSLLVIESGPRFRYVHSSSPYPIDVDMPFALGTGADFALGAMHAGASARDAVEIACKLDIHSGGPVRVVDIACALGGVRLAAE